MKKRKPPIVLISMGVVLLTAVAVINWPSATSQAITDPQASSAQPKKGRDTTSAADLAKSQSNVVGHAPRGLGRKPGLGGKPTGGILGNVLTADHNVGKAQPMDTSVIGQWYVGNSVAKTNGVKHIAVGD